MLAISAAWQLFDAVSADALRDAAQRRRHDVDRDDARHPRLGRVRAVGVHRRRGVRRRIGGAMICLVIYVALLAAVFAYRFKSGAWKRDPADRAEARLRFLIHERWRLACSSAGSIRRSSSVFIAHGTRGLMASSRVGRTMFPCRHSRRSLQTASSWSAGPPGCRKVPR